MKKVLIITSLIAFILLAVTLGWNSLHPSETGDSQTQETEATAPDQPETETTEKPAPIADDPNDPPKERVLAPQARMPSLEDSPIESAPAVNSQEQAQSVVNEHSLQLGLGEGSKLEVLSQSKDDYGNTYYQVEQTYKELPVFGARANLEVERGKAQTLSGAWVKAIDVNTKPTYSAEKAMRMALDNRGVPIDRKVELQGAASLLIFVSDQRTHLCWKVQASLSNPMAATETYIVDAHQPEILLQEALMHR